MIPAFPPKPPPFSLGKTSSGYSGSVTCPCCRQESLIRAKVVADPHGPGKHFEGEVEPYSMHTARGKKLNLQTDLYEAINEQEKADERAK